MRERFRGGTPQCHGLVASLCNGCSRHLLGLCLLCLGAAAVRRLLWLEHLSEFEVEAVNWILKSESTISFNSSHLPSNCSLFSEGIYTISAIARALFYCLIDILSKTCGRCLLPNHKTTSPFEYDNNASLSHAACCYIGSILRCHWGTYCPARSMGPGCHPRADQP
jgi:hypothetical protein